MPPTKKPRTKKRTPLPRGRPPLPKSHKKGVEFSLQLTEWQKEIVDMAAASAGGMPPRTWGAAMVVLAAEEQLKKKGIPLPPQPRMPANK